MPSLGGGGKYGGSDVGRTDSSGRSRTTDRSGSGERRRGERMENALSGGAGMALGEPPAQPAYASSFGGVPGYAGGWAGGESAIRSPIGHLAGLFGGNAPQGPPGQRPNMMTRRGGSDRNQQVPPIWPPVAGRGRQGMIGALI